MTRRVLLSAEGQTEETFVRDILAPTLLAVGVELVNERPTTAPSKRIQRAWPGYLKSIDGPAILAESGLDRLRYSCPHFGEWLTWLESL